MNHRIITAGLLLYFAGQLHVLGWMYAWYIKHYPMKPTWISVLIGTFAVSTSEAAVIAGTLFIYDLFDELKFLVLVPYIMLGCAGVPMAILQQRKYNKFMQHNQQILEVWGLDGER